MPLPDSDIPSPVITDPTSGRIWEGDRYALSTSIAHSQDTYFAVTEFARADPQIVRFPKTAAGWTQAWQSFESLEPSAAAGFRRFRSEINTEQMVFPGAALASGSNTTPPTMEDIRLPTTSDGAIPSAAPQAPSTVDSPPLNSVADDPAVITTMDRLRVERSDEDKQVQASAAPAGFEEQRPNEAPFRGSTAANREPMVIEAGVPGVPGLLVNGKTRTSRLIWAGTRYSLYVADDTIPTTSAELRDARFGVTSITASADRPSMMIYGWASAWTTFEQLEPESAGAYGPAGHGESLFWP